MDPISGVIGGVSNIVGGILNNRNNRIMMHEQNAFNAREAEKAYDRQLDFWGKNNAYNTPEQQMKRLREAGLNPYLMFQNGLGSSGNSVGVSPPPAAHSAGLIPSTIGEGISRGFESLMQGLQIAINNKKANSDIEVNDAEKEKKQAETDKIKEDTEGVKISNSWTPKLFKSQFEGQNLSNYSTLLENEFNLRSMDSRLQAVDLQNALVKTQREYLLAQQSQVRIQSLLAQKELDFYDQTKLQELSLYSAQIYNQYASGNLSYEQAQLAIANRLKTDAETAGLKLNNHILDSTSKGIIDSTNAVNTFNLGFYGYRDSSNKYTRVKNSINTGYRQRTKELLVPRSFSIGSKLVGSYSGNYYSMPDSPNSYYDAGKYFHGHR